MIMLNGRDVKPRNKKKKLLQINKLLKLATLLTTNFILSNLVINDARSNNDAIISFSMQINSYVGCPC